MQANPKLRLIPRKNFARLVSDLLQTAPAEKEHTISAPALDLLHEVAEEFVFFSLRGVLGVTCFLVQILSKQRHAGIPQQLFRQGASCGFLCQKGDRLHR